MNIGIAGGGSIGTQLAVHCAEKKHSVVVYTSDPTAFYNKLCVFNENNKITHMGEIQTATTNAAEAFSRADWIFVTVPMSRFDETAGVIYPYVKPGVKIGLVPGTGGGECFFRKCADRGAVVYGLQRPPSEAKLMGYGKSVMTGKYIEKLCVAALDTASTEDCADIASYLTGVPYEVLPNYLNITLAPSDAVLRACRLYTLFRDYEVGRSYDRIPLFYEEWDDESSERVLKCDEEIGKICSALDMFDLSHVGSFREYYDCETASELTGKLRSTGLFKEVTAPMTVTKDSCIPDLGSEYFRSDIPFGLSIFVQIAGFLGVDVPNMKYILKWHRSLPGVSLNGFDYREHGINNIDDFIKFYSV